MSAILFLLIFWPTVVFSQSLTATWVDTSGNPCPSNPAEDCQEDEFILERCAGDIVACASGPFVEVGRPSQDATSWVDASGLGWSTDYTYRIAARNGSGQSPWSNLAQGQTQAGPQPPDSLLSLTCQQVEISTDPTLALALGFNEGSGITAADSSGNGNDGILSGATWAAGQFDTALSFDGSNDYVDLGGLDGDGAGLTLAAWIKPTSFAVDDARILSKATGTAEADHYWMLSTIESGGSKLRFRLKTNGNTSTLIASAGTLTPGVWIHVSATYDGQFMRLYKDGVEVGALAKTGSVDRNATIPVWVGNNPPSATSKPFHGVIDEMQVYSRALSQAEIQAAMSLPLP